MALDPPANPSYLLLPSGPARMKYFVEEVSGSWVSHETVCTPPNRNPNPTPILLLCKSTINPSKYMPDVAGAGLAPRVKEQSYGGNPQKSKSLNEIGRNKAGGITSSSGTESKTSSPRFATPFRYRLELVTKGSIVELWRSQNRKKSFIWFEHAQGDIVPRGIPVDAHFG